MATWATLFVSMVSVLVGGVLTWAIGKAQQRLLLRRLRDMVLDRERVSLSEEFLMTRLLAEEMEKADFVPDVIFAICPGGAMVAEWLSRRFLGTRSAPIPVQSIFVIQKWSSGGVKVIEAKVDDISTAIPSALPTNSKILLVNDISRSGSTLKATHEFLKNRFVDNNIETATLVCHIQASTKPRFYVAMTKKVVRFDWKES